MTAFPKAGFLLAHWPVSLRILHRNSGNRLSISLQSQLSGTITQYPHDFQISKRQNLKLEHALACWRVARWRDWAWAARRRHAPVGASFTNRVAGQRTGARGIGACPIGSFMRSLRSTRDLVTCTLAHGHRHRHRNAHCAIYYILQF